MLKYINHAGRLSILKFKIVMEQFEVVDTYECFYLMRFDENGQPDWSDPTIVQEGSVESEVTNEGTVNS